MLEYVVKLTRDATQCSPEDHKKLRRVGFDDRGILQVTLIASWFNYINRVADALGVGRDIHPGRLFRRARFVLRQHGRTVRRGSR